VFHVTTDREFNNQNFDFENTTYFARLNQKFRIPSGIDVQVSSNYRGASANAQSTNDGIFTMNIAASKDLFGDDATISMNVSDLFNSRRRQGTVATPNFTSSNDFQWRERQMNLSFTYRFNQKKRNEQGEGRDNGGDEFES
jgi:hypothetical protein